MSSSAPLTIPGRGGLPMLALTHAASGATCDVYLQGAQVVSWRPRGGADVLYTAPHTPFDGSPIRGGIPIAWPQFAAQGPLPMHGFARTAVWAPVAARDGYAELTLGDSPATRALWPHAFALTLRVTFDGARLETALEVTHPPGTAPAWAFEALQHTYLATGAGAVARGVRVGGLRGTTYASKPEGGKEFVEESDAFALQGEVDRVYRAPAGDGDVLVSGVEGGRAAGWTAVRVRRAAALRAAGTVAALPQPLDVVVWNPGPARVVAMPELGEGAHLNFLCVEPGRVSPATAGAGGILAPGDTYTLTQVLTVEGGADSEL